MILLHHGSDLNNRATLSRFPGDFSISRDIPYKHFFKIICSPRILFHKPACIFCEFYKINISYNNIQVSIFCMMKIIHVPHFNKIKIIGFLIPYSCISKIFNISIF